MDDVKKENVAMITKLEQLETQLNDLQSQAKHPEIRDVATAFLKVVDSLKQYQLGLHNYLRMHETTNLKIKAMHSDITVATALFGQTIPHITDDKLTSEITAWVDAVSKLYAD